MAQYKTENPLFFISTLPDIFIVILPPLIWSYHSWVSSVGCGPIKNCRVFEHLCVEGTFWKLNGEMESIMFMRDYWKVDCTEQV